MNWAKQVECEWFILAETLVPGDLRVSAGIRVVSDIVPLKPEPQHLPSIKILKKI